MRFFLPFILVFLASCQKGEVVIKQATNKVPFQLSGLLDINYERSPFRTDDLITRMQLLLSYSNGSSQRLSLQLTNMPAGLLTKFNVSVAYPDFTSILSINDAGAPAGNYRPKIVATPDSGNIQEYDFALNLTGDTSCNGYFSGRSYETNRTCSPDEVYTTITTRLNPQSDTFLFDNFNGKGTTLKMYFDCAYKKFYCPNQKVSDTTYRGSGTITYEPNSNLRYLNILLRYFDVNGVNYECRHIMKF